MDYYFTLVVLLLYYGAVIVIFFRVLLENKNPIKTQSYLLLLALLPLLGLVIYLFFGVNYRKQKLFSRKAIIDNQLLKDWWKTYEQSLPERTNQMHSRIPVLLWRNSKSSISANNEVTILNNGEEKFPALFEALRQAKKHIHIEYYIYEEGVIWEELKHILLEKVAAGVEVRMIYDSIGSNQLKNKSLKQLRKAGVEVGSYNPVIFTPIANKVNYRDHRKIVVIDGTVGFVGGINVSDRYVNNGKFPLYWRDVHMKIHGDAVKGLQVQFFLNWYFVTKKQLPLTSAYLPPVSVRNDVHIATVGSQPDSDFATIMEAYYKLIHSAEHEVLIATPYFVPNSSMLTAMKVTAKSGIKVKLLLPRESDTFFVHAASLSYIEELMENDVAVYLYEKGMIHSKMMVVDGRMGSIGTANMDYRSFDNNAEINAFIFDEKIGQQLRDIFEEDLKDAWQVTREEWNERSLRVKLVGSIGRLIAPLL